MNEGGATQGGQGRDRDVRESGPLVSVIVPVYNTERYLDACLDSLLGQTMHDIEVVCVDDGSSDASGRMLDARSAADGRVRVIHQANAGVSHARNVALDAARGEYVLFVDSDDYVDLNTCEKLVNVARRDGSDIVVFGGVAFPAVPWIDACFDTRDVTYRNDSFSALILETGSHPLMCNKMYRRSLLEANGLRFNEALTLGEDNAFQFCTFPCAHVITYVRDTFYHYRCDREGSAINDAEANRSRRVGKHLAVVEYVFTQWRERGFLHGQEERLLSWSSDFLFRDVRFLSQDERLRVAAEYRRLTDEFGLMGSHDAQAPFLHDWTDFVRADLPVTQNPRVTVVALSCFDEAMLEAGFVSLAGQYVQDVEILCVDAYPDRPSSELLARLVDHDGRARLVASASEALAQARGEWVLFARLRDTYDWEALRKMLDAADAQEAQDHAPDVVCVRDWFDHLRTRDVSRLLHMLSSDGTTPATGPEDDRRTLSPAELGPALLDFSSLDGSNKLWRREYACSAGLDGFSQASVALALMGASCVLPMPERLMTRGSYEGITDAGARQLATSFGAQMDALRTTLEERGLYASCERGYVNAFVSGGMCLRGLMRSVTAERAFLERFAELLAQGDVLAGHDKWWFENAADYEGACEAVEHGAAAFMETDNYRRIEQLSGYINQLEAAAAEARHEVEDVRSSVSYRLGNMMVRVPHKVLGALRRLRR